MGKPKKIKVQSIAVVTPQGGFLTESVSHWKMMRRATAGGDTEMVLTVWFKAGGFLELPDYDAIQFGSLLAGHPY